MDDKRRQSLKTKELFDNKLKQLPDMGIAKNKKKDIGLEFLQRIHFRRRQGNNVVCNALQEYTAISGQKNSLMNGMILKEVRQSFMVCCNDLSCTSGMP